MVVVKNVREFAKYNENDLKSFMRYKTKIFDDDIIKEAIQEFYTKIVEYNSLENFDENYGEGSPIDNYKRYVLSIFCSVFKKQKQNNWRMKYKPISEVFKITKDSQDIKPIWECLGHDYHVDPCFQSYSLAQNDIEEVERRLDEFSDYIMSTEPDQKKAHRMITYLKYKKEGCNGVDISILLSVSNNMVKIIKKELKARYDEWNESRFN